MAFLEVSGSIDYDDRPYIVTKLKASLEKMPTSGKSSRITIDECIVDDKKLECISWPSDEVMKNKEEDVKKTLKKIKLSTTAPACIGISTERIKHDKSYTSDKEKNVSTKDIVQDKRMPSKSSLRSDKSEEKVLKFSMKKTNSNEKEIQNSSSTDLTERKLLRKPSSIDSKEKIPNKSSSTTSKEKKDTKNPFSVQRSDSQENMPKKTSNNKHSSNSSASNPSSIKPTDSQEKKVPKNTSNRSSNSSASNRSSMKPTTSQDKRTPKQNSSSTSSASNPSSVKSTYSQEKKMTKKSSCLEAFRPSSSSSVSTSGNRDQCSCDSKCPSFKAIDADGNIRITCCKAHQTKKVPSIKSPEKQKRAVLEISSSGNLVPRPETQPKTKAPSERQTVDSDGSQKQDVNIIVVPAKSIERYENISETSAKQQNATENLSKSKYCKEVDDDNDTAPTKSERRRTEVPTSPKLSTSKFDKENVKDIMKQFSEFKAHEKGSDSSTSKKTKRRASVPRSPSKRGPQHALVSPKPSTSKSVGTKMHETPSSKSLQRIAEKMKDIMKEISKLEADNDNNKTTVNSPERRVMIISELPSTESSHRTPSSPKTSPLKSPGKKVKDTPERSIEFESSEDESDDEHGSVFADTTAGPVKISKSPTKSPQRVAISPKPSTPKSVESKIKEIPPSKSPHHIAEKINDIMKELSEMEADNDNNKTPVKSPGRRAIISQIPSTESSHRTQSSPKTSPLKSIGKKVKDTSAKSIEIEPSEDESDDEGDSVLAEITALPMKVSESRSTKSPRRTSVSPKPSTPKSAESKRKEITPKKSPHRIALNIKNLMKELSELEPNDDNNRTPIKSPERRVIVSQIPSKESSHRTPSSPKTSPSKSVDKKVKGIPVRQIEMEPSEDESDDEGDTVLAEITALPTKLSESRSMKSPRRTPASPQPSTPKSATSKIKETPTKSANRIALNIKDLMNELSQLEPGDDSNKTSIKSPDRRVIISQIPSKESPHRTPSSPKTSPSKSVYKKVKGTPEKSIEIESSEDDSDDGYGSVLAEKTTLPSKVSESGSTKSPRRTPISAKPSTPKSAESKMKEIPSTKSPHRIAVKINDLMKELSELEPDDDNNSVSAESPERRVMIISEIPPTKSPHRIPSSPKTSPSKSVQKKVEDSPEQEFFEDESDEESDIVSVTGMGPANVSKTSMKSPHRVTISPKSSAVKSVGTEMEEIPPTKGPHRIPSSPKTSPSKSVQKKVEITPEQEFFENESDEESDIVSVTGLGPPNVSKTSMKSPHRVTISPKSSAVKSVGTDMEEIPSTKSPHRVPSSPKHSSPKFVEKNVTDIMKKASEFEASVDAEDDDNDSAPVKSTDRIESSYRTPPNRIQPITVSPQSPPKKNPHTIGEKIKDIIKELTYDEGSDDSESEYDTAFSIHATAINNNDDNGEDVDNDNNNRENDKDDDVDDDIDYDTFQSNIISDNDSEIIEEESFIVYREPDQVQDIFNAENAFTAAMYQKVKRAKSARTSKPKTSTPKQS